ncbi:MAG: Asp23/Gls24 family envelope stress response protein [Actinomycetota bacterium]|nr:Asp23/Gls24 family envelope stress response protein [Actinomycetota bacterium]
MTAVTTQPLPTAGATPAAPAPRTAAGPDERGRLKIDPSVLRKIAEHTADLTPGTLPAPRTVAGVGLGNTGATAKVTVTAQRVDLHMELALRYPGLVRSTVDQLRSRISDEVRRITGYEVRSIAVTVTALLPEPSSRVH